MAQTTSTSVTETINTEVIDKLIISYPADDDNVCPFFRYRDIRGQASPVASFPRWVKDAHEDLATEGTAMTAVELETTDVQVTAARIGLAREPTETMLEDTIIGRSAFLSAIAMDAAILFGMAQAEDGAALFSSATGSISDTGNAITIEDLVNGMGFQRRQKVKGPQVIHLHDFQLGQLQVAQAAAVATPWATFYTPNADSTAFGGYFMGAPIFASSLNPTANGAADRVGCIWTQGQAPGAEMYCAFAYVLARAPQTKTQDQILADSTLTATTKRYGVGIVAANYATKLIFRNS